MDNLIYNPHEKLRIKSEPILDLTKQVQKRICSLFDLMQDHDGIGLAAPQVGWNVKVFVMNITGENLAFINPEVEVSGDLIEMEEACLSVPGLSGLVERPEKVRVKAIGLDLKKFEMSLDGWPARCVLHEYDHLLGVLYIDKARHLYRRSNSL